MTPMHCALYVLHWFDLLALLAAAIIAVHMLGKQRILNKGYSSVDC